MGVLKRVLMLQAITEHTVEAGVTEEKRACEHQPRDREQVTQEIERHRKPFVVNQVIRPRAEAGIKQISGHTQVGCQEQECVPSPSVIQSSKEKERQTEQKELFKFEQVFHIIFGRAIIDSRIQPDRVYIPTYRG